MNTLLQIGFTNALMATALAVLAVAVNKTLRRPAWSHALWLLVLFKLVTPPLVVIPIAVVEADEQVSMAEVQPVAEQPAAEEPVVIPLKSPQELPAEEPAKVVAGQAEETTEVLRSLMLPARHDQTSPKVEPVQRVQELPAGDVAPVAVVPVSETPAPQAEPPPDKTEINWMLLLAGVWIAGSAFWFCVAILRICRFQRALKASQPAPAWLQQEASALAVRMGLSDCPGVWLMPGVLSPLLWALGGYPRLLLPASLLDRLDAVQRQTLLAHELAHYCRRDHWVRCLEFLALGLYWWLPIVWWARRELREAEEECCDAWVIWTLPRAAKAYASALVETLDYLSGSRVELPLVASGLGQIDLLRRRLTMIMRGSMPRKLGGLGFLAVLGLSALLLPLVPTLAQQPAKTPYPPIPPIPPGTPAPLAVVSQAQPQQKDLNKAKAELERAAAELEMMKAHVAKMQQELDQRLKEFKQAQERVKQAEKGLRAKGEPKAKGEIKDVIINKNAIPIEIEIKELKDKLILLNMTGQGDLEKRIANMERKLDEVLQEVRALRKGMGGTPGLPPTPATGGKGGAGAGKGGGAGGKGGGGGGQGGGQGGGGGGPGAPGAPVGGFIVAPPGGGGPGHGGGVIFTLPPDQQYQALVELVGEEMARHIIMMHQKQGPGTPPGGKK